MDRFTFIVVDSEHMHTEVLSIKLAGSQILNTHTKLCQALSSFYYTEFASFLLQCADFTVTLQCIIPSPGTELYTLCGSLVPLNAVLNCHNVSLLQMKQQRPLIGQHVWIDNW